MCGHYRFKINYESNLVQCQTNLRNQNKLNFRLIHALSITYCSHVAMEKSKNLKRERSATALINSLVKVITRM